MSLKKTACLAALLTSLPLAAPALAVAAEPWDDNIKVDKDAVDVDGQKELHSSGNTKELNSEWAKVYIGHAEYSGTDKNVRLVESSNNIGNLKTNFYQNTNELYGGFAKGSSTCQSAVSSGNELYLETGSKVASTVSQQVEKVYGGYATVDATTGTAKARDNKVEFQEGSAIEGYIIHLYGGAVELKSAVTASAWALNNKIDIQEGTQFGYLDDKAMQVTFLAGYAYASKATTAYEETDEDGIKRKAVEASENKLNITYKPGKAATWSLQNSSNYRPGIAAGVA